MAVLAQQTFHIANQIAKLGALSFRRFGEFPRYQRSPSAFAAMHAAAPIDHGSTSAGLASCTRVGTAEALHGESHIFPQVRR